MKEIVIVYTYDTLRMGELEARTKQWLGEWENWRRRRQRRRRRKRRRIIYSLLVTFSSYFYTERVKHLYQSQKMY